jgi:5'-methylthioadenosine phosphorylase
MLAVISGSGVYDIGGLANQRWVKVEGSFGAPAPSVEAILHVILP